MFLFRCACKNVCTRAFLANNVLVFFVLLTALETAHARQFFSVKGSPSESLVRASATNKRRKDWSVDLCISVRIFLLYNYCL